MEEMNKNAEARTLRKTRVGMVVSNKMNKTVVVAIENRFKHPLYKKYITKTKKVMAHDANNECNVGDKVMIAETRPMSKNKCWRLVKVITKAE